LGVVKMNRASTVLTCALLTACAASAPPRDAADQQRRIGVVVLVAAVPTVNTASDFQRSHMSSTFGALGAVTTEILGTQRGNPVYRVKVTEDLELAVSSREQFSLGDCVAVWYPSSFGNRHYFGLGEAGIEKASGCTQGQPK
jgi:hypothetical protein